MGEKGEILDIQKFSRSKSPLDAMFFKDVKVKPFTLTERRKNSIFITNVTNKNKCKGRGIQLERVQITR
ncbi:MAG: hypothetical protein C6W57_16285 [Caldibacillus debilis]|nr:MAG: hypothetical protein C6W57_16285 [Caldibacillus debilis]